MPGKMGQCFILCLSMLLCFGCSTKKSSGNATANNGQTVADTDTVSDFKGTDSTATFDSETAVVADDIFAWDKIHQIKIDLPQADWDSLLQHAQDAQYTAADITIDGEHVGTSGLRFKGSYGNLYGCFNEFNELICTTLSMKLKFSEYVDDQLFQGMKRLNLHSMQNDASLLAEYLGYDVYRTMGVMTSRTSWAEAVVNGVNMGVYAVVEQIDGRFTDSRFAEDGNGDLYKEAWPYVTDIAYWDDRIKTNEDTATHAGMLAFTNALKNATDDTLAQVVSQYVDVNYMLKYIAVNEAINNWDGIMMWYCIPELGGCGNHNYYWYQEPQRPFFWLFPWDLDSTFITKSWNGNPPRWNDLSVKCDTPIDLPETQHNVVPPACDPLIRGLALLGNAPFAAVVNELLSGAFSDAVLTQKIDAAVTLLTPFVERDPHRTVSEWMGYVAQLKRNIIQLRARLILMRDGVTLSPMYLSGEDTNGFETDSTAGMYMTTFVLTNPGSSADFEISESAPISGTRDLRINLHFFDDGLSPWDHWAYGELMLKKEYDFSHLESIRLTVASDVARDMSVRLGSLASATQYSGASWGWEISMGPTVQTLVLPIAELAYPWWWEGDQDNLNTILAQVNAIRITAYPASVGNDGLMAAPEDGYVQIDDIEFIMASTDTDSNTGADSNTDTNANTDTVTNEGDTVTATDIP